jgi:pyruvate formate lyase activating enzyme
LSFGTAGCNLACKFCQNWDISKSKDMDSLMDQASPETIALEAEKYGCKSVAFTYNDPVIFAEYAMDVADACHARGIKTVAVTAGYMHDQARRDFYAKMDAANVDLKAFTEDFYFKLTGAHLQPVLDTLRYLKHETDVWFEITTLLIPGKNDSDEEISAMCQWIKNELGVDVPLHFSAFHPDYKMPDIPATPRDTGTCAQHRHVAGLPLCVHRQCAQPGRRYNFCPAAIPR